MTMATHLPNDRPKLSKKALNRHKSGSVKNLHTGLPMSSTNLEIQTTEPVYTKTPGRQPDKRYKS